VLGRPKVDERAEAAIRDALKNGIGIKKTARLLGCGIATVYRVKNEAELGAVAAAE
jgi:DNA invertase Pin-like site-specific DNA recombinase